MKVVLFLIFSIFCIFQINAQNIYFSESAELTFSSTTVFTTFHAKNNEVPSFLDIEEGRLTFAALISSFKFKHKLMQKKFNEYYIDSDRHPRATFKGQIINKNNIDFTKESLQNVIIEGKMIMNGVAKDVRVNGTIEPQGDLIIANSSFVLYPEDFEIDIPQAMAHQIAKEIYVSVSVEYSPYKE